MHRLLKSTHHCLITHRSFVACYTCIIPLLTRRCQIDQSYNPLERNQRLPAGSIHYIDESLQISPWSRYTAESYPKYHMSEMFEKRYGALANYNFFRKLG